MLAKFFRTPLYGKLVRRSSKRQSNTLKNALLNVLSGEGFSSSGMSDMVSIIGQQLGNYRVLRSLGRGGFAEVYLGQHLYLKTYAALKVLRTSVEDEDVEQFLAEAQTLARLAHRQIVRVLDFAVVQGIPILVMEYAPGGTLRQRHPSGSCLSLESTVSYAKQIAAALQYAHNHNVIHRDVKPENILLGANQEVCLSDFGIALFSPTPQQLTTQQMTGTIPYMAPEQLRGKPCFASDQYALGVVTYEWLCGVHPFEGNYWQLVYQHVSTPPPPLREKDPSLPESVETVILKALAKDPQQRHASVQIFAQALEQAVQDKERDLRYVFEVTTPLQAVSPATPTETTAPPRKVFLSASSADAVLAAQLRTDLPARGISVWNARSEMVQPSTSGRENIRQAIRAVDAVLVVASPAMQSSRQVKEHLHLAGIYRRPILYLQTSGDETLETVHLVEHIRIFDAQQVRYAAALDELVAFLERELSIPTDEQLSISTAEGEPRNPYKGLRAFGLDDAGDFFGRDALVAALMDTLQDILLPQGPGRSHDRLLAVIGPSGSGKSSVVSAGLLPRLQGGALPGSNRWVYLEPMVPGAHPLETLALTLAPHFPHRSVKSIHEDLEDDSGRGLHLLATQLAQVLEQRIVLFIDQFEEMFTLTPTEAERQCFIDLLATAVKETHGPLLLILTLRADFYDRPLAYPELGRLILRRQCVVLPMETHELRAAIKQPAALPDVHLNFEGTLLGDLLYEVQGQPGALPLLQFTLDQLFRRRAGSTLTLSAYHDIGGVKGALAKHAEATYAELPSERHRKLARFLFLRLIDPGSSEQDTTRRRATPDELTLATPEETEVLRQVMAYFIAARLLTTNEIAGTSTIEVSHEALIREWPRLADWLWEAREDVRLQQTLSKDVAEWEQHGKPQDRLYRGSQLKEAKAWARHNTPSKNEVTFLQASAARRVRAVVSVTMAALLVLMVSIPAAVALIRPPWCPTILCPPAKAVTNPNGVHDANLDVYLIAIQSAAYVIPGSPGQYTLNHLPGSIGALRTDGKALDGSAGSVQSTPYRVALGVHSLQGSHGIVIEQTALLVRQALPLTHPFDVWVTGESRNYNNNIYQVIYRGQEAQATLPANYMLPDSHVQLAPGEGDSLDIELTSRVPMDLQFAVQVTYRVITDSQVHTLVLPQVFEVVFLSPSASWRLYQLQNGHFVPQAK